MSYIPPNHTVTDLPEPVFHSLSAPTPAVTPPPKRTPELRVGDRVRKHEHGRRCFIDQLYMSELGLMAVVVDDTPNARTPRERILVKDLILAN